MADKGWMLPGYVGWCSDQCELVGGGAAGGQLR
jgi:hypothetical protein